MLGASGGCPIQERGGQGSYPLILISHQLRVAPRVINSPALKTYFAPGLRENPQAESYASIRTTVCMYGNSKYCRDVSTELTVSSTLAKKMRTAPHKVLRSKRIQKYFIATSHVADLPSSFPVNPPMCPRSDLVFMYTPVSGSYLLFCSFRIDCGWAWGEWNYIYHNGKSQKQNQA